MGVRIKFAYLTPIITRNLSSKLPIHTFVVQADILLLALFLFYTHFSKQFYKEIPYCLH